MKKIIDDSATVLQSFQPPPGVVHSQTTFSQTGGVKTPRQIPLPAVPAFPVLSVNAIRGYDDSLYPSVLVAGKIVPTTSGRAAIGLALHHAGIGPGHEILVPAYHCREMIPPIITAGSKPIFFKITDDLRPDWRDVRRKINAKTKALIAVHYFGLPQQVEEIQIFCKENGLIFIEDCAHAFFGSYNDRPLGSFGHYAIASSRKFFPIQEGGVLLMSRDRTGNLPEINAPGLKENVRQLKVGIEKAVSYGRLPGFKPFLSVADFLQKSIRKIEKPASAEIFGHFPDEVSIYTDHHQGRGMTRIARTIINQTSFKQIAELRRQNYKKLLEGLSDIPGCRPLLPELSNGCVPYIFPLVVEHLDRIFPILEDSAVPMQRFGQFLWDGVDETICPVSSSLSQKLVQFSCHQSLQEREMAWLLTKLHQIL